MDRQRALLLGIGALAGFALAAVTGKIVFVFQRGDGGWKSKREALAPSELCLEEYVPALPSHEADIISETWQKWVSQHGGVLGAGQRLLRQVYNIGLAPEALGLSTVVDTHPRPGELAIAVVNFGNTVTTRLDAVHESDEFRTLLEETKAVAGYLAASGIRLAHLKFLKDALLQCLEEDLSPDEWTSHCKRCWQAVSFLGFGLMAPHMLQNENVIHALQALAQGTASPGGGPASAMSAAQGAALLSMACQSAPQPNVDLVAKAQAAAEEFMTLGAKDMAAYSGLMVTLKCPFTEEQHNERQSMLHETMRNATLVPLLVAERCASALLLALQVCDASPASCAGDIGAAVHLLVGAAGAAVQNTFVNCKLWRQKKLDEAELTELEQRARGIAAEIKSTKKDLRTRLTATLHLNDAEFDFITG